MTTPTPLHKLIDFGNKLTPDEVRDVNLMYLWQYTWAYIPGTATRIWFHYEPKQITYPVWKRQLLENNPGVEFVDITLNMLYGEYFDINNAAAEDAAALRLFNTVESHIYPIANGIVAYQVIDNKHHIGFMNYSDNRMDMAKEYRGDNNRIAWNTDFSILKRASKNG